MTLNSSAPRLFVRLEGSASINLSLLQSRSGELELEERRAQPFSFYTPWEIHAGMSLTTHDIGSYIGIASRAGIGEQDEARRPLVQARISLASRNRVDHDILLFRCVLPNTREDMTRTATTTNTSSALHFGAPSDSVVLPHHDPLSDSLHSPETTGVSCAHHVTLLPQVDRSSSEVTPLIPNLQSLLITFR